MPSNPRTFFRGVPYELCTSVQSGLPFIAVTYIKLLIEGVLAEAQSKYPVTITDYMVMTNHIHIMIVVQDPEDVPRFMRSFKTELAHAMNRLLGRTGLSFWVEDYDAVMIATPEKLLERLQYIYLNPIKAGLVARIEDYPMLNSFHSLFRGNTQKVCKRVSRSSIPELPNEVLSVEQGRELARQLRESPGYKHTLKIEPWAWLSCFEKSRSWKVKEVRRRFLEEFRRLEKETAKEEVVGASALRSADIRREYKSKRKGIKMLCMSSCPEQRKSIISWLKQQIAISRESYRRRARGDRRAIPPPGFFLPGGALLANLVVPLVLQL